MVTVGVPTIEIEMNNYERKWTWEVGEKKFVIDYILFSRGVVVVKMVIEESGKNDVGSEIETKCSYGEVAAEVVLEIAWLYFQL